MPLRLLPALSMDGFEFRDSLKTVRAARRTLDHDEALEAQAEAGYAMQLNLNRIILITRYLDEDTTTKLAPQSWLLTVAALRCDYAVNSSTASA